MTEITLDESRTVIVDDCDAELVRGYRWSAHSKGYAATWHKGQNVLMHRLILGQGGFDGTVVDHVNGNKLDNRRENLRVVPSCQNQWNMRKQRLRVGKPCHSRFKGVCFNRMRGKWLAYISQNGRRQYLGCAYADEESAARAYDAAAVDRFGDMSLTNRAMGLFNDAVKPAAEEYRELKAEAAK